MTNTISTLSQVGQRPTVPGPCAQTASPATGPLAPHVAQVLRAAVISVPKTSIIRPPIELPSSASISVLLTSGRGPRSRPATSVAGVPLLFPRVSVHVIAVHLPEARLVVVPQRQAAYPLGAL